MQIGEMSVTFCGEWISWTGGYPSEERMRTDLAYIYYNQDEFEDWKELYNDGCDIYFLNSGKSLLYLMDYLVEVETFYNAKVQSLS